METTEEAFTFYKKVFGSDFTSITRMGDMPRPPGAPQLNERETNLIMNIQMPITNGHILMATDMISSMGQKVEPGNNVTISLDLDTAEEAERIYSQLLEGSEENSGPLAQMPWGALWGSCKDRYGVRWMISYAESAL